MSWIDQRPDDAMAGAFEAIGPDQVATVDSKLFREAMSRLGAAVHVVTTAGPAGKTNVAQGVAHGSAAAAIARGVDVRLGYAADIRPAAKEVAETRTFKVLVPLDSEERNKVGNAGKAEPRGRKG